MGCSIVSIGNDSEQAWETRSAPRLHKIVDASWFDPLKVLHADITTLDFRPLVEGSRRTLVFWDAHGRDVADAVLGRLLPFLPTENKVIVDDIWATPEKYGLEAEYHVGPLWSLFDELPHLWEYLEQNQIVLEVGDRWITFSARG